MRLRPLTEAECYARCYGGRRAERLSFVHVMTGAERRPDAVGEPLRQLYEGRPTTLEPEQGLEAA